MILSFSIFRLQDGIRWFGKFLLFDRPKRLLQEGWWVSLQKNLPVAALGKGREMFDGQDYKYFFKGEFFEGQAQKEGKYLSIIKYI